MKKLFTGLFRAARKRLQTTDNDMGMFRDKLNALVEGKDTAGDEEVAAQVQELVEMTNDLPESEDKAKLLRFIEDFKSVKEQDAAVAQEAAKAVADLFEKLDTEAMKDSPDVAAVPENGQAEENGADLEGSEESQTAGAEGAAVEEKDAACSEGQDPAEKKTDEVHDDENTAAGNIAEYTLEEVYQFMKKRMAEDAEAEAAGGEPEQEKPSVGEETAEEEVDEVTQDHGINLQLPGTAANAKGTLAALFADMKNGGR